MVSNKISYSLMSMISLIGFLYSCDKYNQDYYAVRVECFIPYSKTPVKGLKYTINETKKKYKLFGDYETYKTGWTLQGKVGNDGIAETMFTRDNRSRGYYGGTFDYSEIELPPGEYDFVGEVPSFILDENHTEIIRIYFLPRMNVVFHYKNLNCIDVNDSFKSKTINIDEYPKGFYSWENIPWTAALVTQGCADYSSSVYTNSGRYVIQWEAERGGMTTSGIDTFLVSPETTNTINMFW